MYQLIKFIDNQLAIVIII